MLNTYLKTETVANGTVHIHSMSTELCGGIKEELTAAHTDGYVEPGTDFCAQHPLLRRDDRGGVSGISKDNICLAAAVQRMELEQHAPL